MNNKKINELEIAILGCYIPLYTSKSVTNKLIDYKSKNNLFNDLINIHIKEPLNEIKLVGITARTSNSLEVTVHQGGN